MSYKLPGGNYNGRGIVHLPHEICRTILGGGGTAATTRETNQR